MNNRCLFLYLSLPNWSYRVLLLLWVWKSEVGIVLRIWSELCWFTTQNNKVLSKFSGFRGKANIKTGKIKNSSIDYCALSQLHIKPKTIKRARFRGLFRLTPMGKPGHRRRAMKAEWSGMAMWEAENGLWVNLLVVERQGAAQGESTEAEIKAAFCGTTSNQVIPNLVDFA